MQTGKNWTLTEKKGSTTWIIQWNRVYDTALSRITSYDFLQMSQSYKHCHYNPPVVAKLVFLVRGASNCSGVQQQNLWNFKKITFIQFPVIWLNNSIFLNAKNWIFSFKVLISLHTLLPLGICHLRWPHHLILSCARAHMSTYKCTFQRYKYVQEQVTSLPYMWLMTCCTSNIVHVVHIKIVTIFMA
jgi:hypothetical protein